MALPGYYRVNFTDPRKPSFIIEPYQTDGTISPASPTIDAKARRASTSLLLYGRDVPNYGERIAENFVQLLENFSGPGAPQNPIEGQLWFDTGTTYNVFAWSSPTTLLFAGDLTAQFNQFVQNETVLTLAFSPINVAVDNSMQLVDLVMDSCILTQSGATAAIFKSTDGTFMQLPKTAATGFLALESPGYSRLRVATTLADGEIHWLDINNVLSATDEPEPTTVRVGDLWYNTNTSQLMICGSNGHWKSVAARYIPITGTGNDPITGEDLSPMEGDINMGPYKVFSQGVITTSSADRYTLINRDYADNIKNNLQAQVDDVVDDITEMREGEIKSKVSRAGDEMTGVLIFGDGQSTSTLTGPNARGIDANGYPIVNALNDWSIDDYMLARFDSNHVVDKAYIAKSLTQFQSQYSQGDGFISVEPDGSGRFPQDVSFKLDTAGITHKLSWYDVTRTKEHSLYGVYSGTSSQFVVQAGVDSTIDFRNASQSLAADPLFRIGDGATESSQTVYILDGQPQPVFNGDQTTKNDDTSAATKGFVRQYLKDTLPEGADEPDAYVSGGSYTFNLDTLEYSLTLLQTNNKPPLAINSYHEHSGTTLPYTYSVVSGLAWSPADPIATSIAADNPNYPELTVSKMLRALNVYKAPIVDAIFMNSPRVGAAGAIVEVTNNTIQVIGAFTTAVAGSTLMVANSTSNDGVYFVSSSVPGPADVTTNKPTTLITINGTFPTSETLDPTVEAPAYVEVGAFTPSSNVRGLITRSTLDTEIEKVSVPKYLRYTVTEAATNPVRNLGFGYRMNTNKLWVFRNGQKLLSGIAGGGDYDEVSTTTIKIAAEYVGDVFEVYQI